MCLCRRAKAGVPPGVSAAPAEAALERLPIELGAAAFGEMHTGGKPDDGALQEVGVVVGRGGYEGEDHLAAVAGEVRPAEEEPPSEVLMLEELDLVFFEFPNALVPSGDPIGDAFARKTAVFDRADESIHGPNC